MARRSNPEKRARIVRTTRDLIRRNGIPGTTMLEVIEAAGGSRGSLYHYFPGGKTQMVEDAVRSAIQEYSAGIEYLVTLPLAEAIPLLVEVWRAEAEASDYAAGCPVVAAALGGAAEPTARVLAAGAFSDWIAAIAALLRNSGVPADRTESLATLALAAIEGAVVLSLAQKSSEPMVRVAAELVAMSEAFAR